MTTKNLTLPGNLRYQPRELQELFGYDNAYRTVGEVEIATLRTLGEIGFIPSADVQQLTDALAKTMLDEITTTEVDEIERKITHHDIRAWVRRATSFLTDHNLAHLARWLHIPLTSYDALHTARTLQYARAWQQALQPACKEVLILLADKTEQWAEVVQVGRTHGQHALPITVGFWLATILERIRYNVVQLESRSHELVGKISGAVGAYNAHVGLGIAERCGDISFETRVLEKLELKPAFISTQILPPEPLAYFLHAACMVSASVAQFGRDCRHLMRSDIAELSEEYEKGQVGSSTMAHKRNPITFEQLEGMWLRTKNEYGKVFDTLISEHQRDLVGSSVERDFPIILINLQQQLNSLKKQNKKGIPFLKRIMIDTKNCQRNFGTNGHLLLSEPVYIGLILGGFPYDAHEFVNNVLTPQAQASGRHLVQECGVIQHESEVTLAAHQALMNLPPDMYRLLSRPEGYIGRAKEKALEIAALARSTCKSL